MPIKTQNDLPAKEILENENIFVMDEFRALHQDMLPCSASGYASTAGIDLKQYAGKAGHGAAAAACLVQYPFAGGCDLHEYQDPCVIEYPCKPSQ